MAEVAFVDALRERMWITGVAHEIRNRLNSLQIHVGVLRQELKERLPNDARDVTEQLDRVAREMDSMNALASDLLQLAQVAAPAFQITDLGELAAETARFLGPEGVARGVALTVALDDRPVAARVDRSQMRAALLNLVLNALQATAPGGTITIATRRAADVVTVSVTDTGAGIPEGIRDRVFQPFVSGRPGGTGLGLTIVERIVTGHSGRVEIESQPGRGTLVAMTIPVSKDERHG